MNLMAKKARESFTKFKTTIDMNLLTEEDMMTLDNKLASEDDFTDTFKFSRTNTNNDLFRQSELKKKVVMLVNC